MANMKKEAEAHPAEVVATRSDFSSANFAANEPFKNEADAAHWEERFLKARLPE